MIGDLRAEVLRPSLALIGPFALGSADFPVFFHNSDFPATSSQCQGRLQALWRSSNNQYAIS
jgi:hypothetical protein